MSPNFLSPKPPTIFVIAKHGYAYFTIRALLAMSILNQSSDTRGAAVSNGGSFRRDGHPNMSWRIFVAYCSSREALIALKSAPTPRYRSAMSLGEGSSSSHQ
jgi:hypothetical protein